MAKGESTISKSWMASFQTSTEVSIDELIEFEGAIPSMKEFTTCHWEYMRKTSVGMNSIWSYCTVNNETDTEMRCTQFAYKSLLKTANRNILIYNVIAGRLVASIEVSSFESRSWNNFCWSCSSITGINKLYYNGNIVHQSEVSAEKQGIIYGSNSVLESAFIISLPVTYSPYSALFEIE